MAPGINSTFFQCFITFVLNENGIRLKIFIYRKSTQVNFIVTKYMKQKTEEN